MKFFVVIGIALQATFALLAPMSAAEVNFSEQIPLNKGSHQYAPYVHKVDFEQDGDTDFVAFANYDRSQITWWENTSAGGFTIHVVDATAEHTKDAWPGDLDGDGDMDIVALTGPYGLVWYENQDGGERFKRRVIREDRDDFLVRVGDFNRDGKRDLALAGGRRNGVVVLYGEATGEWSHPHRVSDQQVAGALWVADIDQDGVDDLIEVVTPKIVLHRSDGGKGFQSSVIYRHQGVSQITCEVHDVDRDGAPDLLATDLRFVDYLRNVDGASFPVTEVRRRTSEADLQRIDVADFNGNGENDLLLVCGRRVDIGFNRGHASWEIQKVYKEPKSIILNIHPADLDGDGDIDLVNFGHLGRGNIYWLKNQ